MHEPNPLRRMLLWLMQNNSDPAIRRQAARLLEGDRASSSPTPTAPLAAKKTTAKVG